MRLFGNLTPGTAGPAVQKAGARARALSVFAVLASPGCDLGLVAYEMTLLVERVGRVLTPALRGVDVQPSFGGSSPITELGAGPSR